MAPKKKAKKAVVRKTFKIKPLEKTISRPKMPKSTKPKRVQTATGWRRMMLKAKASKAK